jgi:hypothetical protein
MAAPLSVNPERWQARTRLQVAHLLERRLTLQPAEERPVRISCEGDAIVTGENAGNDFMATRGHALASTQTPERDANIVPPLRSSTNNRHARHGRLGLA